MCKEKLITGVTVTQQMSKARAILNNEVIPQEKLYQLRKKNGSLTSHYKDCNKADARFNGYRWL